MEGIARIVQMQALSIQMRNLGNQWKAYAWARYSQLFPLTEGFETQVRRQLYFPHPTAVRIPKWRCVTCDEGNSVAWDKCIKCHIPRDVNHELIALGMQHAVQTGEDPTIYDAWTRFMERREQVAKYLAVEQDLSKRAAVKQANHAYLYGEIQIPRAVLRHKPTLSKQGLIHPVTMPRE